MKDVASDGRELDRWSRLAVARKTFVSRGPDVEEKEKKKTKERVYAYSGLQSIRRELY